MSSAAAAEAPAPAKGKKKLIIMIAVAALVLVGGGGVGFMLMSKKKVDADEHGEADAKPAAKVVAKAHDPKAVPVFVPLEPFTVNLADRDAERFAQVGITLEFTDAKIGEQVKVFMPAIRNNVLMAIADRTAAELLGREGKDKLARKVGIETARVLGYDVDDEDDDREAEAADDKAGKKPAAKKKKKRRGGDSPVKAVHFSNFIVQ